MRAVVQRVSSAKVQVDHKTTGQISAGLLVYLGIGDDDTHKDLEYLAKKVAGLRIFPDDLGAMNRSLLDVGGSALVISQFTLFGDVRKGKRPSFNKSMEPNVAEKMYEDFTDRLSDQGITTARGVFGAMMQVMSTNDGPVTILLDSKKLF